MSAAELAGWRDAPLTYDAPGCTLGGQAPPGFDRLDERFLLRRRDLDGAAADLFSWRAQTGAGLRVRASEVPLELGTVVLLRIGLGPLGVTAPCQVVQVVDEPDRRGFAYGTLPGHPESGEELFVLERRGDGALELAVTAFSRPASLATRVGGPVARRAQRWMAARYAAGIDVAPDA
ncbi:DUF1990 domain-containing protein [Nocardioides sp. HDW12B]|nr:DUF1990 domain-containing protein [Nocardioides sp. HDW12B]